MLRFTLLLLAGALLAPVSQGQTTNYQGECWKSVENATVHLPASTEWSLSGYSPAVGDTIALRTGSGVCAGYAEWTESGATMAAIGDDEVMSEIFGEGFDGYAPDEPLKFEVYDASEGEVLTPEEVFYASCPESDWIPEEICSEGLYFDGAAMEVSKVGANPLPVEVAGFRARMGAGGARLSWETASEDGNAGFEVQRLYRGWKKVGYVTSKAPGGNSSEPIGYTYRDDDLPFAADVLEYRLLQRDLDGSTDLIGPIVLERGAPPLALVAVFPNPARDHITARFSVPSERRVELRLYDLLGRVVRSISGDKRAGREEVRFNVSSLSSGVYFVQMSTIDFTRTKRITVLR